MKSFDPCACFTLLFFLVCQGHFHGLVRVLALVVLSALVLASLVGTRLKQNTAIQYQKHGLVAVNMSIWWVNLVCD